jgi:AraC-like DNA-binding protein
MRPGDFALVRTSVPFSLTSDASVDSVDSETAVAATKDKRLKLGTGKERPVTLHAGKFIFDTANEDLLMGMLPSLVHIKAGEASLDRVRSLVAMNKMEAGQPGPAGEFIIVRLVELILVEILRSKALGLEGSKGLLSGLADPITAKALSAMHNDLAHGWTVAALAKLCGVSRSTFATRFRMAVGIGPIEYLSDWRIALAKDELRLGTRSIGEIAFTIGFQSSSAFSTAFTRAVGCSPKQFGKVIRSRLR